MESWSILKNKIHTKKDTLFPLVHLFPLLPERQLSLKATSQLEKEKNKKQQQQKTALRYICGFLQ